jgi:condensin complex subunit 3
VYLSKRFSQPDRVIEFILHALEQEPAVQAVAVVGIAKLMLSGIVDDSTVLQNLVLVYFAPETSENQDVRQCLSYFLPVYCYSSSANQRRMQEVSDRTFFIYDFCTVVKRDAAV